MGFLMFLSQLFPECFIARWTLVALLLNGGILLAQPENGAIRLENGEQVFKAACAACHGADGRGTPQAVAGFQPPRTFPDFTRCDQTTSEPDSSWKALVVHGGPYRGFSQIMPSFAEALTDKQIDQVIGYLRSLCKNSHWPRGELNLPRALVTEKAYPENEVVVSSACECAGDAGKHDAYHP